jgi:hypothetical protein
LKKIKKKNCEGEYVDFSLPLYCPSTKKIDPETAIKMARDEDQAEVKKWLTDPKFYTSLLRNTPIRKRRVFKNSMPEVDVRKIVEAGIIRKADAHIPSAAFLQIKSVNERRKMRRRLILETRCLNRAIRATKTMC